jgi:hypothetical protein
MDLVAEREPSELGDLAALLELRQARRHNRLARAHWIDALYRAYLAGLAACAAVVVAAGAVPDEPLGPADLAEVRAHGPGAVGLLVAIAVAIGLRSGARGGPLTLEPATVAHELQAPVERARSLRGPAVKQLRFLVGAAAVVGAVAGALGAARLSVPLAESAVAGALAGALAASLAGGAALAGAGRRLRPIAATALGAPGLVWAAADAAAGGATSPFTAVGAVALWPLHPVWWAAGAPVLAAGVVALAFVSLGGLSIEAANRRAALVSQLRFAVTLQDVRTVVLLRRQLTQERPRNRPWLRMRRRPRHRLPAVVRRDLQGLARIPAMRAARLLALAVVAGVSLGAAWRGTTAMVVLAGLALYLAAYDAVEPIAQEVDHPSRWSALAGRPGMALLGHLPVAVLVMAAVVGATAASALALAPARVVAPLTGVLLLPVALAAAVGAAVSTSLGAADPASTASAGPESIGLLLVLRVAAPPALVVGSVATSLLAGHDADELALERVSNASSWTLLAVAAGIGWLATRHPAPDVGGLTAIAERERQLQRDRPADEADTPEQENEP